MAGNEKFVFDLGNQWLKDGEVAPFFGFPSWWRRFIFQVLSPRDISVYLYLCSTMDNNAIAYPTIEQIADDMAVDSHATVKNAVRKLVDFGFLLRNERSNRNRRVFVYQRPAVEYTLLKLLKPDITDHNKEGAPLLDARLYPVSTSRVQRNPTSANSDSAVNSALKRILGGHFDAYIHMLDGEADEARDFLAVLLDEKLQTKRDTAVERVRREISKRFAARDWDKLIEGLPENLRDIMRKRVEQQSNEGVPF